MLVLFWHVRLERQHFSWQSVDPGMLSHRVSVSSSLKNEVVELHMLSSHLVFLMQQISSEQVVSGSGASKFCKVHEMEGSRTSEFSSHETRSRARAEPQNVSV